MSEKEIAVYLGGEQTAEAVLNRRLPLTLDMIKRLYQQLSHKNLFNLPDRVFERKHEHFVIFLHDVLYQARENNIQRNENVQGNGIRFCLSES